MSEGASARLERGSAAASGVAGVRRPRGDAAVFACLVAVCGWLLAGLFVQVRHPIPFLNDSVLHFGLIRSLASAPARGQSLLDPWVGTWCFGFPVFHYYQCLPHFLVLGLWTVLGHAVSLVRCFQIVNWLAIGTFPVPVFLAMRRMGFDRGTAVAAAALSPMIKTNYLHGHDLESYVWQGLGQYTQAFGGWLFPLAVAWLATALRDGRSWVVTTFLLVATFLSHLALGTMVAFAGGVIVLVSPRAAALRLRRLVVIGIVVGAACAWMLLPILRDFTWYNLSTLVPSWKYHSFGAAIILRWLVTGQIYDYAREVALGARSIGPLPVLTVLVAGGVVLAAFRARRDSERTLLALFVFFLLLYFGRPTWGSLLRIVPLGNGFHYSRALFGVHVFGVMLAGPFLATTFRALASRGKLGAVAAAAVAVAVFAPLVGERSSYLARNAKLVREAAAGYAAEGPALERALAIAAQDRLGRAYAGLGGPGRPWGGTFLVGWVPVYAWFPIREMDALGYLYHMWSLNADFEDAFDEGDVRQYRALGVRRILVPAGLQVPAFTRPIAQEGRFRVLAVDGPGLVELVDAPFRLDVRKRNLSRLQAKWLRSDLAGRSIHPRVHMAEEGPATDGPGIPADDIDFHFPALAPAERPVGEILGVDRRGDDFDVRARVDRPGYLLLRMSYHPGWRAFLDGREVRPVPLMPSFLGVALEPGAHEVALRYRPDPSRGPLLAFGILVLVAAGAFGRRIPV